MANGNDTATTAPAPDPAQAIPATPAPTTTTPEVVVNAQAPSLSDMDSPYTQALSAIDPQLGQVERAIQAEDEPQIKQYERASDQHLKQAAEWEQRQADLAEQAAQWTQKVGPEMAQYIEKTPTRQGIYAANMHIAPMLAIISAIGGKLTRASGLQMLAATTGAVQGMNQGNEQAYQAAIDKWKTGLEAFQTQTKMQEQYYSLMLKAYGSRADAEEKAAERAERMAGNMRSDEQKKLASAATALRAQSSAAAQLERLELAREGLDLRKQLAGLQAAGGAQGPAGVDAPLSQLGPGQILGTLAMNGIPMPGSRYTIMQEVQGLQASYPDMTLRELTQTMRERKLSLIGAGSAIRAMETRTAPVTQAQIALTQPDGLYDRLQASAGKVNFGDAQVANEIRNWSAKRWSANPDIQRYMTDLEDTRAELATVLSRGGRTSDQARGWAEEALPAVTSRKALNAAVDESRAIGERVLQGDVRAIDMVAQGKSLTDIYKSIKASPPPATTARTPGRGAPQIVEPTIANKEQFDGLDPGPNGVWFVGPDGKRYFKPPRQH